MSNVKRVQVRDFAADRAVIDAATSGPWEWVPGKREYQDNGSIQSVTEGDICDFGNYTQYYPTAGSEPYETDITFITEARTGWPAALDRIAELEAEITLFDQRGEVIERQLAEIERAQSENERLFAENAFYYEGLIVKDAEIQRYRQALESITKIGEIGGGSTGRLLNDVLRYAKEALAIDEN